MDIEKDATEFLNEAKRKRAEARGAASESSSETEKTKEEQERLKEKTDKENADIQAQKDEEILRKKDNELNADEKKRKAELLLVSKKEEEKKEKSNVQKRFDELTAKIKSLEKDREVSKAEKDAVKKELDDLKKELSMTPEDIRKENVRKEMSSRISKYAEEDKKLPLEERREMTQEELDEWRQDNFDAATEWVTRRSLRRVREEEEFIQHTRDNEMFNKLLAKQKESEKVLLGKHPELDVSKRTKELKDEGKKPDEIFKVLCDEIPKYKLASEILRENQEKYILSERGPELIAEELNKRLNKAPEETSAVDDLKKKLAEVEAELERVKNLDVSISSTRSPVNKEEPEMTAKIKSLAKEVGLNEERVAARLKRREETGGR